VNVNIGIATQIRLNSVDLIDIGSFGVRAAK
jgi:hypothetical protein